MTTQLTNLLGLVAASLTTLAFLPQVIRTWRLRSAQDLSLGMFSLLCVGVALWLVYGLLTGNLPIIAANGATLVLCGILLYFKLAFKK
ncbi:MAG: SemiSWEET transporter [Bernardetiaceae bacterium]|nr:SemiSWEET transporter [Bernardetiaceae bacterium]